MTFEQRWIENDFNPFILFDSHGKILSLNTEAQYLLGSTTKESIFELASAYASSTFGFKTTFMDLEFDKYKFFGINVGYESDHEIAISLYRIPHFKFQKNRPSGKLTNVYTLIDLCISSNSIGSDIEYVKNIDPSLPEVRLHEKLFIKLLSKVYASMKANERVETRLYLRIGEHIKFDEKKYSIFSIEMIAPNIEKSYESEILRLADENNLFAEIKTSSIKINIPMIFE
jgi:nitrogen-specific signal transduction histidine kinase